MLYSKQKLYIIISLFGYQFISPKIYDFKHLTFSLRCCAPWPNCTLCFRNCAEQFLVGATLRLQPVIGKLSNDSLSLRQSVRPCVHNFFWFLNICWQITWKKWHNIRHADVSRWLTLGRHRCRWVFLSFYVLVHPSNCPRAWILVLRTNLLEGKVCILACWYIEVAYHQFINVYGYYCPSVRPFSHHNFSFLCLFWEITLKEWHKTWLTIHGVLWQLGCRFDIMDYNLIFLCFDICNYICHDTSYHFSVLPS